MSLETVLGMYLGIFDHHTVSRDLGDDRRRLDFLDETVSTDDVFQEILIDPLKSIIVAPVNLDFGDIIRRDTPRRISTIYSI